MTNSKVCFQRVYLPHFLLICLSVSSKMTILASHAHTISLLTTQASSCRSRLYPSISDVLGWETICSLCIGSVQSIVN
jgi:hypothetical protein